MNKTLQFISGRRGQWKRLAAAFGNGAQKVSPLWMHCASLGEFEQGRTVLEAFRQRHPDKKILLTFFSPSGYEIRKNTPLADHVFYLPLDTPRNARRFLDLTNPCAAVFIKYEFWYFYLTTLKKRGIPTYLVSARFRPEQLFFKKYGAPFRRMLACFTHIFVQDERSLRLLSALRNPPREITVAGDTRFDSVGCNIPHDKTPPLFLQLVREPVLIAGSTWPEDETLLERLAGDIPELQIVLAPHQVCVAHLESIRRLFSRWEPVFFSRAEQGPPPKILVIDSIGVLSSLYRHGTVCYIGGGFNPSGIHNTLEAAVHSKPILFGPNYEKFKEACDLKALRAAADFRDYNTMLEALKRWLADPTLREKAGKAAGVYVLDNIGATDQVLEKLVVREP
ncbi:MAG TPA: glycosyltransferase N-terminal domain-containing protein [Bacteroidales bacterium]|jgi:3-deoxy-D-manno-octulosonic-acid transferase|nr:3-deoxy-D-manno-octulosonic acid transferase [Bacteroidales bacterium]MBP8999928.1 3-deoxy-D-manno-octulosonic acid transferase [Bacteroidales bacterium]HOF75820.1 glycosyltransferase N-terminal domain-containing protein [Bacteroidales bacterium]HOQ96385.1 glycosyltransferase N-terminal domain-containing protein [Bacteroidales bacterium]HPL84362.1 glycosyltransferase N-terminal domain-containing protein [Bacteroidales bacterium]